MNFFLIGQPNVGKSSIYNILTNNNKNIIHSKEGTTIDWHSSNIYNNKSLSIYETPGLIINDNKLNLSHLNNLLNKIDIFFYVINYSDPQNLIDKEALKVLRKFDKKIILIINKDDSL